MGLFALIILDISNWSHGQSFCAEATTDKCCLGNKNNDDVKKK